MEIKSNCRFFNGMYPCSFHKLENVHCDTCNHFDEITENILIVKLGAIGDVIRTTPLLHKIWELHPKARIWWLTYSPEIIPTKVDRVLEFNAESIVILQNIDFSIAINLDKDIQACAILSTINADKKYGYILKNGIPAPIDLNATPKFLNGLFDDLNKLNTLSYPQEIFNICGWEYNGEEYILDKKVSYDWNIQNNGKKIIALNTGCGARWISRLWSDENWLELIKKLQSNGYFPLLVGGMQEDEKNRFYSENTGALYLGHFDLNKFISLIDQSDLVVSAVTMGMHIAIGLKKPLVLINNIFNPAEFELYGRGEIIMPTKECKCFFSPKCKNEDYFCMDSLTSDSIFVAIERCLN